jgi:hypothetical protein
MDEASNLEADQEVNGKSNRVLNAEFFDEYDRGPKKKSNSPGYKHVQVVRKHDERKKLATASCKECVDVSAF